METAIEKIEGCPELAPAIEQAAEILRQGGLVAFPTETVYGLGGNGLDPEAAKKIYAAKGRPADNPLILHICSFEMLSAVARELSPWAKTLVQQFWPGPMTLILPKGDQVPMEATGGLDTVAVRLPKNDIALALIEKCGFPIAGPSANASGRPSPTRASHVAYDLSGKIEMILDGGPCEIGLESTIIDVTGNAPVILRPGYISEADIARALGKKPEHDNETAADAAPKAPGMKYRHYAPKAEITIVSGEQKRVAEAINSMVDTAEERGKKAGVLIVDESRDLYNDGHIISIGSIKDMEQVARNLFRALRKFDFYEIDVVFAEGFPAGGIGDAVMNRLMKAAAYRMIKV